MRLERAILLVGSARPRAESASGSLGRYLLARLEERGIETRTFFASHVRHPVRADRLVDAIDGADLFVLSSPLYVDSLPYLVTLTLERIAAHRGAMWKPNPVRFLAIVNCGFPEPRHTRTALDIARAFAQRARLAWAGGLGVGGGELIGGRPLEATGRPARRVARSLDLAAEALVEGRAVPEAAMDLLAKPLVPPALYTFVGGLRWRRDALRSGAYRRLGARPYEARDEPVVDGTAT